MHRKQLQINITSSLGINEKHPLTTKKFSGLYKKASRKKIWELDHHFHCSAIGTCLTLKELRNIARKCKQDEVSDYSLHHWFVMASTQVSTVSKMLNKKLGRKFARDIRLVNQLHTDPELTAYWQRAKSSGDIAGPYWALITQPATSEQALDQIYGDIHMLSHLTGASCRIEQQTLKQTQAQNIKLEQTLDQSRKQMLRLQSKKYAVLRELGTKEKKHIQTQKKLNKAKNQLKEFAQKTETSALQRLIDNLSDQLSKANQKNLQAQQATLDDRKTIQQLERQVQRLSSRLEKQAAAWWQKPAGQAEKTCPVSGANNEAECPHPDLCGRKILYVGGRINSCPYLKSATEIVNGCFLYHDGGLEENPHKLTAALQQADVVFFPPTA